MLRCAISLLLLIVLAEPASAGTGFEVTSMKDGKPVTYMVNFGGGFRFEQHTAYDPVSKKFVYLQWPRDGKPPKPVGEIWVHQTGETLQLYKFPDVKTGLDPLSVRTENQHREAGFNTQLFAHTAG